jgi:SAM-dependent methyltransferase
MDYFLEGMAFSKRRGNLNLVQADAYHPPFSQSFDIIGAFDVIEHLQDDTGVLRNLHSMLRPNGILLLTVPAHPCLWSDFDVRSKHCRRYTGSDLKNKLAEAGFTLKLFSPFMSASLPLLWLQRKWHGLRGSAKKPDGRRDIASSELRILPVVNMILRTILCTEAGIVAHGLKLPFGSSFIVMAQR